MTAWVYLVLAGLLEIVWALALKHAGGFTRPGPAALAVGAAAASFFLLALALRTLPVGLAYAVWVGIGVAGVALVGMLALGEPASVARLAFLALVLTGIAGLKLVEA